MIINFSSIVPLVILGGSTILIMLVVAIHRNHFLTSLLSIIAIIAAFISMIGLSLNPVEVYPLFVIDGFAIFFMSIFFLAGIIIIALSYNYLNRHSINKEEYYLLVLTAIIGAVVLAISKHFVSLFLGLEILSVSLYVLIAYLRSWNFSIEAGVKYLIMASVSSAFLLFGMALIYAESGSMIFSEVATDFSVKGIITPLAITGLVFMLVGVGFKMALIPFHFWIPDVYEGSPAPVGALIATISKGGIFAVFIRFFTIIQGYRFEEVVFILSLIAVFSMLVGNWLALKQDNIKRILGYSSIAHLGYLLVAFLAGGNLGIEAASFYFLAYFITIIGAFGIISITSGSDRDAYSIRDYNGFFWRRPWIASLFTIVLLSLAGIPLTAGFIGKFYILSAGIESELWLLVVVLVISSVIGLYYYLRIVVEMFGKPDEFVLQNSLRPFYTISSGVVLAIITILIVWYGVYPGGIMNLIENLTSASF